MVAGSPRLGLQKLSSMAVLVRVVGVVELEAVVDLAVSLVAEAEVEKEGVVAEALIS